MKKILNVVLVVVLVVAGYFILSKKDNKVAGGTEKYSSQEVGLEFDYKSGPDGYVLEERMPVDLGTGLVKVIVLQQTKDANQGLPEGGESPANISISVFENTQKQFAGVWAQKNPQYSNVNLVMGEIGEVVVGGANAVSYIADGLYANENFVVAHGDNIYVFSGQFLDAESNLRKDFGPLVESVKFIPKPGQN